MYYEETMTKASDTLTNKIRVNIPNEITETSRQIALAVEPGCRYSIVAQNFHQVIFRNLLNSLTGVLYTAGYSSQFFNVNTGTIGTTTATNDTVIVSTSQPFAYEAINEFGDRIQDNTSINPIVVFNIHDITAPTVLTFQFNSHVNYATTINPSNFNNYVINRFVRINYIERDNQVAYGNTSLGILSSLTEYTTDLLRRFQTYQMILTTVTTLANYYTNFLQRSRKLYIE